MECYRSLVSERRGIRAGACPSDGCSLEILLEFSSPLSPWIEQAMGGRLNLAGRVAT